MGVASLPPPPILNVDYQRAVVIGWSSIYYGSYGGLPRNVLKQVELLAYNARTCERRLGDPIMSTELCAGDDQGGKDACLGDPGGPLLLNINERWVVVGLVSFGIQCAEPGSLEVYTRVSSYLDWIAFNAA